MSMHLQVATYLAFKMGEELVLGIITSLVFSILVSSWARERGWV
jgi:hypothetical protein